MRRWLSSETQNVKANEILDALQRSIGNKNTITSATNKALIDICSSNLLEYLISIYASSIDSKNANDLVYYIHRSRGETSEEKSLEFAASLATCLEACCEQFNVNAIDTAGASLDKDRIAKVLEDRARRADAAIVTILSKLTDKNGIWLENKTVRADHIAKTIEEQFDPLIVYTKAVANALNTVDIHGASGDVLQVSLDEIYVDVPVSAIARERNFNHYQDIRHRIPRLEASRNWQQTLGLFDKAVLLGDPGGGKSTLSKKLCMECARGFGKTQGKLPVFIQLRTYIAEAEDDERYSLTKHIVDQIFASNLEADRLNLDSTILYYLRIGAAFIVADGLDEVLTSANRSRVIKELTVFAKTFPICSVLITSRYVGYEAQPMVGFRHFGVDLLNDSAVDQIYRNVSKAVLQRPEAEIEKSLPNFRKDSRRKAEELIRSPLLLTLIVIIYNAKSEIPDNRASLYSFCAELLFERWDSYRKIVPDLPERYRLFDLFKHLSSLLYESEKYGGRISKLDLENEAQVFFRDDYVDNKEGRSKKAAKHMVSHLTGRAWILHEVGEGVFEFTHRTFLEFFYAQHLDTVYEDTSLLVAKSISSICEGQRTVPTHLALQIRTKDKRAASSKVAKELSKSLEGFPQNRELVRFCLDSFGYLLPDAGSLAKFVEQLAPQALSHEDPYMAVSLLCNESPLKSLILKNTEPALMKLKKVNDAERFAFPLTTLSASIHDESSEYALLVRQLISNYLKKIEGKQTVSPYICKLIFDLDGDFNKDCISKYGLRLWFNNKSSRIKSLAFAKDTRRILSDVSSYLTDANYKTGKYFELAKLIKEPCFENIGRFETEHLHIREASSFEEYLGEIVFSSDQDAWRDDREALELYAFSLALFVEANWSLVQKKIIERAESVFVNLTDSLEANRSPMASFCNGWINKTQNLMANGRLDHPWFELHEST